MPPHYEIFTKVSLKLDQVLVFMYPVHNLSIWNRAKQRTNHITRSLVTFNSYSTLLMYLYSFRSGRLVQYLVCKKFGGG